MVRASDNVFPKVQFSEETAPATPSVGEAVVYVKSDGKLYLKDDAGAETDLTGGGGGATLDSTILQRSDTSPQSALDATNLTLTWDSEVQDDLAAFDSGTSDTDIVIPSTGLYQFNVSIWFAQESTFQTAGTNLRRIKLTVNGVDVDAAYGHWGAVDQFHPVVFSFVVPLTASDVVKVVVNQTSGETLQVPRTGQSNQVVVTKFG